MHHIIWGIETDISAEAILQNIDDLISTSAGIDFNYIHPEANCSIIGASLKNCFFPHQEIIKRGGSIEGTLLIEDGKEYDLTAICERLAYELNGDADSAKKMEQHIRKQAADLSQKIKDTAPTKTLGG